MLSDTRLTQIAELLVAVPGVVAVMLGGSRARGAADEHSDVDLGLYYETPLDVPALQQLAEQLATARPGEGATARVTRLGEWGPWVDGGGWLSIDDTPVDWIYRELGRVERSWQLAQQGRFDFHAQVGHPLGVPDFGYAGEVALGRVLADPTGRLTRLKQQASRYPPRLAQAIAGRLDEAEFLLGGLAKPAARGDTVFVAGILFRVLGLCAHVLHARLGRWVITEKGLIQAAGRLPGAPPGFAERAQAVLGRVGTTEAELSQVVRAARGLLAEVRETRGSGAAEPPAAASSGAWPVP